MDYRKGVSTGSKAEAGRKRGGSDGFNIRNSHKRLSRRHFLIYYSIIFDLMRSFLLGDFISSYRKFEGIHPALPFHKSFGWLGFIAELCRCFAA